MRIRITSATVANFLLGSARSTFLLFLTLSLLTWTLRACNWASWLAKSTFLLSIDFPSFWKSNYVVAVNGGCTDFTVHRLLQGAAAGNSLENIIFGTTYIFRPPCIRSNW